MKSILLMCTFVVGALGHTVIQLHPDFNVVFHMAATDTIEIQVTARTTGWVGFGFSNTHSFTSADMVIGGVNDGNNGLYHGDYWSTSGDVLPVLDTQQDWSRSDQLCTQNGTHTTMYYSRKVNTGDVTQDLIIPNGNVYLVWSYGAVDTLDAPAMQDIHHDPINFIGLGGHGGSSAIHGSVTTVLLCALFFVYRLSASV